LRNLSVFIDIVYLNVMYMFLYSLQLFFHI